jgi:hypothetical protein
MHIFAAQMGFGQTKSVRENGRIFHERLEKFLTKKPGREHDRTWLNKVIPLNPKSPEILNYISKNPNEGGFARDEYPFATTNEGGEGGYQFDDVSLQVVSAKESSLKGQAKLMREFYHYAQIIPNDPQEAKFVVLALPFLPIKSGYYLRDKSQGYQPFDYNP